MIHITRTSYCSFLRVSWFFTDVSGPRESAYTEKRFDPICSTWNSDGYVDATKILEKSSDRRKVGSNDLVARERRARKIEERLYLYWTFAIEVVKVGTGSVLTRFEYLVRVQ